MYDAFIRRTATSYDTLAEDYARRFHHEMDHKPFDRHMLLWLAGRVGDAGTICDLGCGPGQVAAYLKTCGADVCGIDLSAEMVAQAARLHPDIPFRQDDMLKLATVADGSLAGIAAFYSIIHIPREGVVTALRQIKRALQPGGLLLLTFHIGDETRHFDDLWGHAVDVDFLFFETDAMKGYLAAAGFEITEAITRDPYPETVEVATRRAYFFARRPNV
jgi:SAM-dependent methyltransferase